MARLLEDAGFATPVVFEAQKRVGGKSLSAIHGDVVCELGTSYTHRGDRLIRKWWGDHGISSKKMGLTLIDGEPFVDYVKGAGGASLLAQGWAFHRHRSRFLKKLARRPHDRDVLEEGTQSIKRWLRDRKLYKIERFFQRVLVPMGYGSMDDVLALQGLRLIGWDMVISGISDDVTIPVEGWSEFWSRMASRLDVRTGQPVTAVKRSADAVTVETPEGIGVFDYVINTLPLDRFQELTDLTDDERFIADGVEWGGLVTNLLAVEGWFVEEHIRNYARAYRDDAEPGMMIAARREGHVPELGGALYIVGQFPGSFSEAELRDMVIADVERDGGRVRSVVDSVNWVYFARYRKQALELGLLDRMTRVQGQLRTFHTGSTFSQEAVGRIADFNKSLLSSIRKHMAVTTPAPA